MDKRQVKKEQKRLVSLLERASVPTQKQEALAPIIYNMAWQKIKLEEAWTKLQDEDLVCEYKNGADQYGTRENPFFKAYISLWKAYMMGFEKYVTALPKELQEEANGQALDLVAQVMNLKKAKA